MVVEIWAGQVLELIQLLTKTSLKTNDDELNFFWDKLIGNYNIK